MRKVLFALTILCAWNGGIAAYVAEPRCVQDLAVNFFSPDLVRQALSLRNVPQGGWNPIINQLSTASHSIPQIMHAKVSRYVYNPLDTLAQQKIALQILQETLFDTFVSVMRNNNYAILLNQEDFRDLFDFIWKNQLRNIRTCLPLPFEEKSQQPK